MDTKYQIKGANLKMERGEGRLRILKNAANKLERYNRQYGERREYYLNVLRAIGNDKALVGDSGEVAAGADEVAQRR